MFGSCEDIFWRFQVIALQLLLASKSAEEGRDEEIPK
jgi:hypothetical protein